LEEFSLIILVTKKDEKIVVIPNGVDVEMFSKHVTEEERKDIRREYGFADTDTVVVTTSRLTKKNGVDTLIDSMVLLPASYKLMIIGAGEDEQLLRERVVSKHLTDRVVFVGKKPYDTLYMYLASADVFTRLSRSEGFGNSFIEAMATGIPVIGTNVGGIVDFLEDGITGYVVDPENENQAKEAIIRATTRDTDLLARAKKMVNEKYTWKHVAVQFDNLFRQIL
jgi:glycosyltransferase involved in cell wall biosynthesis